MQRVWSFTNSYLTMLYSEVEMESGELLTAKQVRELQKQKASLEEENLILCHIHATLHQRLRAVSYFNQNTLPLNYVAC